MSGSEQVLCLRCLVEEMGDQALLEALRAGIDALPQDMRAEQAVYRSRLAGCRQCENLVNGICKFCGCFVEMRALRRAGTCPDPRGSRWNK